MSMFSGRHWPCETEPCSCSPEELARQAEVERQKAEAARAMTPEQWGASFTVPFETRVEDFACDVCIARKRRAERAGDFFILCDGCKERVSFSNRLNVTEGDLNALAARSWDCPTCGHMHYGNNGPCVCGCCAERSSST